MGQMTQCDECGFFYGVIYTFFDTTKPLPYHICEECLEFLTQQERLHECDAGNNQPVEAGL